VVLGRYSFGGHVWYVAQLNSISYLSKRGGDHASYMKSMVQMKVAIIMDKTATMRGPRTDLESLL